MPAKDENALLLGEIHGLVKGLREDVQRIEAKTDGIDSRVRSTEATAAKTSMATSGILSVGMALVIEGLKALVPRQG